MVINKVIKVSLICLSVLFVYLQIIQSEYYADLIKTILFLGLTSLFLFDKECDCIFFKLFLLLYTVGQILSFATWYIEIDYTNDIDYIYYVANSLYILSYILLIWQILSRLNLREIVSKYYIAIAVLIILDIFCVSIVSATTEGVLGFYEYTLEFLYNGVIMALLSVSMINFMHRDDKRSINMLMASIFIVFSEIIQLAYFYVAEYPELNIISSIFLVFAFTLLYLTAKLENEEPVDFLEKSLEA
ncbi:hypothetical protein RM697_02645 [Ichthyenterobacterium sp. W332]|uniref:Uncharacterized protein n=1 Tax=Microcosmobacter mediterraneus TaxID=3075607 RepID=A0ABU2YJY3_9FLAO|nr:hypothetical protein [Ichthyenterobacterium sp. W332]MDT0557530.1 hypothetical protein [Ichthyenterobacterium sp. W332]